MRKNKSKWKEARRTDAASVKLPFRHRIGTEISAYFIIVIFAISALLIGYTSYSNQRTINQINTERSQMALSTMNALLEDYEMKSAQAARSLAGSENIRDAVSTGQAAAINEGIAKAVKDMDLDMDFVTVTDARGTVIARSGSDKIGDSIADQVSIARALQGETASHFDFGTEIEMGIRTSSPLLDESGNLMGVVSTGYSLLENGFVDRMKEITGNEFTVFLGDERVSSTIMQEGERIIGTKLDGKIAETVLQEGKPYIGQADILGLPYATVYQPVADDDQQVKGIFFSGVPLAASQKAVRTALIQSLLIGILLILLANLFLMLAMRRVVTEPIKTMTQTATGLSQGNLHLDISHHAKNEVGVLAEAMRVTEASIAGYIEDISEKLGQMAEGDMRVAITKDYIGDYQPIRSALLLIAESLNRTLSNIYSTAEQVSVGAEQVAAASQSLASGASEQAASLEGLTVSVISVAQEADQNVVHVKEAAGYVSQAADGIENGNRQMQKLAAAMEEIRQTSRQITEIAGAMEDIAFQTNILSLNAAVEAARAGSAGKGFAVVAEEVRSLSLKSAEAAKQTGELIEKSAQAITAGSRMTAETAGILREVAEEAGLMRESIGQIELASSKQADAIEKINTGLSQISDVVQTNAATAQESSASSEELAAQAQLLKEEVGRFKLNRQETISIDAQKMTRNMHNMRDDDFSDKY